MITSFTEAKTRVFYYKFEPENLVKRKENADTIVFWEEINEEQLEVSASESKSSPLVFKF